MIMECAVHHSFTTSLTNRSVALQEFIVIPLESAMTLEKLTDSSRFRGIYQRLEVAGNSILKWLLIIKTYLLRKNPNRGLLKHTVHQERHKDDDNFQGKDTTGKNGIRLTTSVYHKLRVRPVAPESFTSLREKFDNW